MDVTCERCGTEYEFDETLVSDRGTTVKCTNCGHLFKVFRGGTSPGTTPAAAEQAKTWTLRTQDGASRSIQSLKELQRMIAEGQVAEDDELSRSGEAWKRLGDIAELQTFFAAARAAAASPRRDNTGRNLPRPASDQAATKVAPPPRGKGTMMGVGGRPAAETQRMAPPPPSSPPPPRRAPAPAPASLPSTEYEAIAEETVQDPPPRRDPTPPPRRDPTPHIAAPPPRRDPTPPRRDPTPPTVPPRHVAATREAAPSERPPPLSMDPGAPPRPRSKESRALDPEARPARPSRDRSLSDAPPRLRMDEDDAAPSMRPPRRSSSGLWVGLVLVLAVGAGVALGWDRIQALLQPPQDGAVGFLAAGDDALARDRDESYRDAIGEYTKALALDDHDVRALIGLSRAHALLAQNRLFEANDLDARAGAEPDAAGSLHGEASALRREVTEHGGSARENAELAVRVGTGGADAEVVLADALRLSADPLARSRMDRARTLDDPPSAEALRVDALLTAEGGSLAAALPLAEAAVHEDPGLLRARLLLARAHLAAGHAADARAQVQAVLTRDPEHPIARSLMSRLDGAVDVDAGVALAAPPVVASGGREAPEPRPGGSDPVVIVAPPTGGGGGGGGARSYEALIAQAREILDNGNPSRARALYDQALSARPGGPEALTGVGFCMLASGDASGALGRFRTAAATGYSEALIGMGDAYRRMEDLDRALEAYEQYLSRSPSGPHASIARRQADRLRASGAHTGGESSGGGGGGGASSGGSEGGGAPETAPHELPGPAGSTEPAPNDTPAIDSEP